MRTLHLVQTLPYPPRSGGDLRAWHLRKEMSRYADQTILCRLFEPLDATALKPFADLNIDVQGLVLPRPSLPVKAVKAGRFVLSPYPVSSAGWFFRAMQQRLRDLLASTPFDLVSVESSWLCAYWPIIRQAHGRHVLELYDIVTEYLERQTAMLPAGPWRWLSRHDTRRMRGMERAMVESSDLVIVTSERERAALQAAHPGQEIVAIPNGVDDDAIQPLPEASGHEILFVGALDYFPNLDGILYFVKEVLPVLRVAVPDAIVHVVGRNPPAEVLALAQVPGVHVVGEADRVEPWYRRACLSVVPLRVGGGTRLKIPESMAYGRPVVTTTLGCEGLDVEDGRHLLIADTPQRMSESIAEIMRDPALAKRLTENALERVRTRYAWRNIAEQLHEVYARTIARRY